MSRSAFIDFCTGQIAKRWYVIMVPVFIAVFYAFIIIAVAFYHDYDWITMSISSLGDPDKNPWPGWLFFSLAVGWTGLSMLPFYIKLFRQLETFSKIPSKMMIAFCIISSAGLVMLGCFSEREATAILHYIAAGLAFGGFFIAAACWWLILGSWIKHASQPVPRSRTIAFIVMIVSLSCAIAGLAISQAIASPGSIPVPSSWYMNFAFWEWTCVHVINLQIFLLACVMP